MAYGLQVYNSSGFVQFDTTEAQYKNFVLESTATLSVGATGSSIQMDSYLGQENPALQNITYGDLIFVRPTNTNMFPFTVCTTSFSGFTGDVDISVRSAAAGNVEIRKYTAVGDADFSSLVSALPAGGYGLRVYDANGNVTFDNNFIPTTVKNVIQSTGTYVSYTGSIPFAMLNPLTIYNYIGDGDFLEITNYVAEWTTSSSIGMALDTSQYSSSGTIVNYTAPNNGKVLVLQDN